ARDRVPLHDARPIWTLFSCMQFSIANNARRHGAKRPKRAHLYHGGAKETKKSLKAGGCTWAKSGVPDGRHPTDPAGDTAAVSLKFLYSILAVFWLIVKKLLQKHALPYAVFHKRPVFVKARGSPPLLAHKHKDPQLPAGPCA